MNESINTRWTPITGLFHFQSPDVRAMEPCPTSLLRSLVVCNEANIKHRHEEDTWAVMQYSCPRINQSYMRTYILILQPLAIIKGPNEL